LKKFKAAASKINMEVFGYDIDFPEWYSDWHNHLSV
jgi:hypothetical protein